MPGMTATGGRRRSGLADELLAVAQAMAARSQRSPGQADPGKQAAGPLNPNPQRPPRARKPNRSHADVWGNKAAQEALGRRANRQQAAEQLRGQGVEGIGAAGEQFDIRSIYNRPDLLRLFQDDDEGLLNLLGRRGVSGRR